MAKIYSVAMSKNAYKKKKIKNFQALPKEGSQLRDVYDILMNNKNIFLDIRQLLPHIKNLHQILYQLQYIYGLEIEYKGTNYNGSVTRKGGRNIYKLVGEWFGTEYKDYTLQGEGKSS